MTNTETTTAAADEQPRDLEHFLAEQLRRVLDAELERVPIISDGTELHPHWIAECTIDGWTAHGPIEPELHAAVRKHVSTEHPTGQLCLGMLALLRRYHAAHTAAEQGVGTPLATAQGLALRALHRALRAVASGFADQPGYNLGWTDRG